MPDKQAQSTYSAVSSHTEWDLLEEVMVGIVDSASFLPWYVVLEACLPNDQHKLFCRNAGKPFPSEQIAATNKELEDFVCVLEGEGVKVRRSEVMNQLQPFGTPGWTSTGFYNAMPRDILLVIGTELIVQTDVNQTYVSQS